MYGFKIHMAGTFKEESYLVQINGKNTVRFRNTAVIGNGTAFSFAAVGNHIYVVVQIKGIHTAILLDELGFGKAPCSTTNMDGYVTDESFYEDTTQVEAVDIHALDVPSLVKTFILETLIIELDQLDKIVLGWNPMMGVTKNEYDILLGDIFEELEEHLNTFKIENAA